MADTSCHRARLGLFGACLLLVLSAAPLAGAQEEDTDNSALRERALELFGESAEHYREGRYAIAAELLREAYRTYPEPVLLLNLGRALEQNDDPRGAVEAYEGFLEQVPDAEERPEIEERLEALEAMIAEEEAEEAAARPSTAAPASPASTPSDGGSSPVPWILAGTGGAVLGAGLGLGIAARNRNDEARDEPVHVEAVELKDRADRLALGANILFGVGGAAMIGGLTWGLIQSLRGEPGAEDEARLEVGIGLGTVVLRGPLPSL